VWFNPGWKPLQGWTFGPLWRHISNNTLWRLVPAPHFLIKLTGRIVWGPLVAMRYAIDYSYPVIIRSMIFEDLKRHSLTYKVRETYFTNLACRGFFVHDQQNKHHRFPKTSTFFQYPTLWHLGAPFLIFAVFLFTPPGFLKLVGRILFVETAIRTRAEVLWRQICLHKEERVLEQLECSSKGTTLYQRLSYTHGQLK